MLEFLYSDKFDEEIALRDENKSVTRKELKHYISSNLPVLNLKKKNVVILTDDILG